MEKYLKWTRGTHYSTGIRGYIDKHPDPVWNRLAGWSDDRIAKWFEDSGHTNCNKAGKALRRYLEDME